MTYFKIALLSSIVFIFTMMACNDPSEIGTGILSDNFSDIRFTDTINIRTVTTKQDSIFTYTSVVKNQPPSYLVGNVQDPVFGTSKASLYLDFILNTPSSVSGGLKLEGATFDSLVLSLAYDSLQTYGDTLKAQTLDVYRVREPMNDDAAFLYSDQSYATDAAPIGTMANFYPKPRTTTQLASGDSTRATISHLRVHLDAPLGLELMSYDSALYANSDTFQTVFQGLKIASPEPDASILGFNLSSKGSKDLSYLRLYYSQDTSQHFLTYLIGASSVKFNEFEHDYTGSVVEPFIDNVALGDSLIFTQGMSGTHVKLDFPNLKEDYKDVVVNKAELEFTVASVPGDDTLHFTEPHRLALTYLNSDGNYVFIDDLTTAVAINRLGVFGGTSSLVDENGVYVTKYKMSLSDYFQDIIDGGGSSMYLQVYTKNQLPHRTIMYGGGHSKYPVKLLLTYTKKP